MSTEIGAQLDAHDTPAPMVSVIIPAYNAEKFILDAVRSVLEQDYPSVEILLIDDGSRDRTVKLVREESKRVQVVEQANAGAAAARNTGLRHATGRFICFLDADDGWLPGKLAAQAAYLESHPSVGAVYHEWLVLRPDESGAYARPALTTVPGDGAVDSENSGWIYLQLLLDCIVHTSTVMIRQEVARNVGYFDTTLATGEDYDYWLRLSRQCEIHKLKGTYSFYREAAGSLTSAPRLANNEYRVLNRAIEQWGLIAPNGTSAPEWRVRRRLAKLAFDFGYAHYHNGSIRSAKEGFLQASRHEPFGWRTWAYYLAASIKALAHRI